jgi:sugar (pentulose or hexulose) kinase
MGGGAKSALWNQIKADVTGLPVTVPEATETTALGAALLALVGCRAYANLAEAYPRVVKLQQRFEPRPETQAAYAEAYGLFRRVYASLEEVF